MVPPEHTSRKSRIIYDFSIETLEKYSYYRQDVAAKMLGVAPITLKRICQRHTYRWPYRTLKARARREARLKAERTQSSMTQIKEQQTRSAMIDAVQPSVLPKLKSLQRQQLPTAHLLLMLRNRKEDNRPLASLRIPLAMQVDGEGDRQPLLGSSSPPSGRVLLPAHFPLSTDSTLQRVHLESRYSLTQLLRQQQTVMPPASPPLSCQGTHTTHPSVEPKNAVTSSKAGFPGGKLSSPTESTGLQSGCKLPSADFLLLRFPHSQYNARA